MKVLFIGNSHTFFNDMPELFARFVEATTGEKPDVTMLAYGGRDYQWHRKEYFPVRFALMYGGFDYCVLQQAAHSYPPREETIEYGKLLIEMCQRQGVKPVIFMTWPEKRMPENIQKMVDVCTELAGDTGALLSPIGQIWQKVTDENPDIDLYYRDGEHAGSYGGFLIAATLCRQLAGDVSDSVSGVGHDFFGDMQHRRGELPAAIEEKDRIGVALDRAKTDTILRAIKAWPM